MTCQKRMRAVDGKQEIYLEWPNGEVEELSKRKKRLLKSKCDYRDVQIKKQGVRMIDKDNEDMHRLMNELTPHVENEFNKDSPSICCGRSRSKYNSLKTKKQMRWHPLIIHFALSLQCSSRAAYHMVTRSDFFVPVSSERTLRDYSHYGA